jgi:hypothetical protein
MAKLISALAISFVSVLVAGCMAEAGPDVDQESGGEMSSEEGVPGDENVGEANQSIQYNDWNGSCADSLTLRFSPGGSYKCGYQMSYGTALYPYYSDGGSWAYVYVGSGPCNSMTGWVLKDYVSRNCLL